MARCYGEPIGQLHKRSGANALKHFCNAQHACKHGGFCSRLKRIHADTITSFKVLDLLSFDSRVGSDLDNGPRTEAAAATPSVVRGH